MQDDVYRQKGKESDRWVFVRPAEYRGTTILTMLKCSADEGFSTDSHVPCGSAQPDRRNKENTGYRHSTEVRLYLWDM